MNNGHIANEQWHTGHIANEQWPHSYRDLSGSEMKHIILITNMAHISYCMARNYHLLCTVGVHGDVPSEPDLIKPALIFKRVVVLGNIKYPWRLLILGHSAVAVLGVVGIACPRGGEEACFEALGLINNIFVTGESSKLPHSSTPPVPTLCMQRVAIEIIFFYHLFKVLGHRETNNEGCIT